MSVSARWVSAVCFGAPAASVECACSRQARRKLDDLQTPRSNAFSLCVAVLRTVAREVVRPRLRCWARRSRDHATVVHLALAAREPGVLLPSSYLTQQSVISASMVTLFTSVSGSTPGLLNS